MGIFDSIKSKSVREKKSTKGFYFGATEAEGENIEGSSLVDYFKDYLNVMSELENGKFIFVGRKGVGKSAIAKFIQDSSEETEESYSKLLRISDFELENSIQLPPSEEGKKEQLIFEWLILVNIVKLIISNECGKYTLEYNKLKKFLEMNSGMVDIDKYQVVDGTKKTGGEINFGGLMHVFGGVFKRYFDVNVNKAPFYKLIPPLKDILKIMLDYSVNKDLEFWLLFDDLDTHFNVKSDKDNDKIMELIRIAKIYNNEVFKANKAKILIFLRDDIRDSIITRYADSAKIFTTYEILLNWYNHKSYTEKSESLIPLKQLANKRIEINFDKHNIEYGKDAWLTLFQNVNFNGDTYPCKTSFKYVLDFTFYRPRDIITFLSMMTTENYKYPLDKESVKQLLAKYIKINVYEIKSELKLFFSDHEIEVLFHTLFPFIINSSNLTQESLSIRIDELNFIFDGSKVIEILLNYSLIILIDESGTLFFNYRSNNNIDNVNKAKLTITLPKCIYHNYRKIN
jgi:hypothetical protein